MTTPVGLTAAGARREISHRLHVVRTLYVRDLSAALFSPFVYLLAVLACALASYFASVFLSTIGSLSVMVSSDPLRIPLVFTAFAAAVYLGISSSVAIAHEREQKTLEVLFYGPVTPAGRIAALFLRDLTVFVIVIVVFFVEALLVSWVTNLTLGALSLRAAAVSIPLVCPMVALSLLISAGTRKTRSAVLLFISLFLVLAGLQVVSMILDSIPAESASLFVMYVRRALFIFLSWIQWLSPFSYIARVGEFLEAGGQGVLWVAAVAFGYALVLLAAAAAMLARRRTGA